MVVISSLVMSARIDLKVPRSVISPDLPSKLCSNREISRTLGLTSLKEPVTYVLSLYSRIST